MENSISKIERNAFSKIVGPEPRVFYACMLYQRAVKHRADGSVYYKGIHMKD